MVFRHARIYKYGQSSLDNQNMIQFGNPHTAHDCAAMLYALDNMPKCDSDIVIYIDDFGIIHIARNISWKFGIIILYLGPNWPL